MTTAQHLLPPEPTSASRARRFTVDVLRTWDETDSEDVVTLLVSELVTNAVLHAGSPVAVALRRRGDCLRVEVGDESPVIPALREYADDATTGRGLELLDLMADDWGIECRDDASKVVWFEVRAAHAGDGGDEHTPRPEEHREIALPEDEVVVRLRGAPVQLFPAVQQHTDALLREYALIAMEENGSGRRVVPRLPVDMRAVATQLHAAVEGGRTETDLVLTTAASAREAVLQAGDALEEADALAFDGRLLSPPTLPEIKTCRSWMLDEVLRQIDGDAPRAWTGARPAPRTRATTNLDHQLVLDTLLEPVVVADDTNHITYANRATEKLLGWGEGELVGQRLTALIPERLHEAHIAGYTRYLITRRARLLGRPVRVPARRRDGSEVEVELLLRALTPTGGRQSFVALLHTAPQTPPSPTGTGRWPNLLDTVVARRAAVGELPQDEAAAALLQTMVTTLGWQLGCWWELDGDSLAPVAVWSVDAERYEGFEDASRRRRFARGEGLPGRVWDQARPVWLPDVVRDANYPRMSLALAHDLRCACALPLRSGDDVTGVVELMTSVRQDPDDGTLATLDTLGRLLPLRRA